MILAQVAVGLHREGAAVAVAKPAGNGGNIDAALDAPCREQVAQIVVGKGSDADNLTGCLERTEAAADVDNCGALGLGTAACANLRQERAEFGNDWHDPIACLGLGARNRQLVLFRVEVLPLQRGRLAEPQAGVGQKPDEIRAIDRPTGTPGRDALRDGLELIAGG